MSRSQILWLTISLPLFATCIVLGVVLGWGATVVIVVAAVFPDVSLISAFASAGRLKPNRVKFYNLLHSFSLPFGLALIGCILLAFTRDFTALLAALAWITHITIDRACGYRLRAADGTIRPAHTNSEVAQ